MIGVIIAAALVAEILLIIFLPVLGWSILGLLALVIVIALVIPIGAHVCYMEEEFSLSARIASLSIKLLPKRAKDEAEAAEAKPDKPKKEKKPKAPKAEGEEKNILKKLSLSMDELLEIVKKLFRGLGKFGKFKVYKFVLHYTAAGKDPYSTAMTYNYINAALSSLAPLCDRGFRVKGDVDVRTDVDFVGEKMQLEAELIISLRLIQLVHVALAIVFGVLAVLIRNRIRIFKEKRAAKKENKNAAPDNNTKENAQTDIKTEERTDSNG